MTREGSGAQAGETRTLGRTGIEASAVGLGAWAIGAAWGRQSEEDSIAAIQRALDLGCRFIDTARRSMASAAASA